MNTQKHSTGILKANIPKLYALNALNGGLFALPIIVLFWEENGLNLTDIFILQAFFALSILLLEIPSGYLSDRCGRVNTLIVGSIAAFIGFIVYSFSHSMTGFLCAELFIAIGNSMHSGTLDALTYDTLLELKEEKQFQKINGKQFGMHFGTEALSSIVGGALAIVSMTLMHNLRLPMYFTTIPFFAGTIIGLTLIEPQRKKLQETRHIEAILHIGRETLLHNVPLRSIIVLGSIISTISYALFWFIQPYQTDAGLPLEYFGLAHAVLVGMGALASAYTYHITKRVDDRIFLIAICCVTLASCIALGFMTSLWGLIPFLLMRIVWSCKSPLVKDIINRMTTSDIRATVLSLNAFSFRMLFILTGPLIGYAADIFSMQQAMFYTGIIGAVMVTIVFVLMRGVWKEIPK